MSVESRRALITRWREDRLTMEERFAGLPPPKPGASLRTRQRYAKLRRELQQKMQNEAAKDLAHWKRFAYVPKLLDIVEAQFTEAEWAQRGGRSQTLPSLYPDVVLRLHAKVHELQAENAALKRQLTQATAHQISPAYKRSR